MKKILLFIGLLVLTSCSINPDSTTLEVVIPVHQWEKDSSSLLWYTLKWTCGDEIKSLHLGTEQRRVSIEVMRGESVFVCAYPLDNLNPLGAMICPLENKSCVVLNPNDGVLCGYLIEQDRKTTRQINTVKLKNLASLCSSDYRDIDSITFLKDTLNGELSEKSFQRKKKYNIGEIILPNGKWIAENRNDISFSTNDGLSPELILPVGTYSWLCPASKMELTISVDLQGHFSTSKRLAGI